MSTAIMATATVTMPTHKPKRRRKGKGARARERREAAQKAAQKVAEAEAEKAAKLAAEKATLPLKRGDVVVTVPSDMFPESVELTVNNLIYNPNRKDWMVTFTSPGSQHAWLNKNLGRSFEKKVDEAI